MSMTDFIDKSNRNKDADYEKEKCAKCWRIPSELQRKYSMDKFGENLCFGHQPTRRDK